MGNICSEDNKHKNYMYLICNGQSVYNKIQKEIKNLTNQAFEGHVVRFDHSLLDCELSEEGRNQAFKLKEYVQYKQVSYVFVSPLRRALQTANIVFSQYKQKPRIIILPLLREILSSSSDINSRVFEAFRDYPNMDFTHLKECGNVLNTYLQDLTSKDIVDQINQKILRKYGSNISDQKVYSIEINQTMKELYPDTLEKGHDVIERVNKVKAFIQNFLSDNIIEGDVFIVGHKQFFEYFTAQQFEKDKPKVHSSIDYGEIQNWEFK